jgi:hypothetical protein
MQRCDFEVRRGDDSIADVSLVELSHSRAIWPALAGIAKGVFASGSRIRVRVQSGEMVISIGIAAAHRLRSA